MTMQPEDESFFFHCFLFVLAVIYFVAVTVFFVRLMYKNENSTLYEIDPRYLPSSVHSRSFAMAAEAERSRSCPDY